MKCPCKGCPKAGCAEYHDVCERYRAWKLEKNKANYRRAIEIATRNISHDHEMKYRKNLKAGRVRK